jgi:hypothetical protein
MRHLGSLLAGVLIAPVAWVLIALGQQKSASTISSWVSDSTYHTADLIAPAAYLVAAGILLGLVATLRISPLGAVVAGAFYVGVYATLFVNPLSAMKTIPNRLSGLGQAVDPRVPVANGTLALIGVALLIAAFSAKRWRRWPVPAPAAVPAGPVAEPAVEEPAPEPVSSVPEEAPEPSVPSVPAATTATYVPTPTGYQPTTYSRAPDTEFETTRPSPRPRHSYSAEPAETTSAEPAAADPTTSSPAAPDPAAEPLPRRSPPPVWPEDASVGGDDERDKPSSPWSAPPRQST